MKLTLEQLQAVANQRQSPDFVTFMTAVADECSKLNEMLIKRPEGSEYLRGQVYALSLLLETVSKSSENFELAKQPKR